MNLNYFNNQDFIKRNHEPVENEKENSNFSTENSDLSIKRKLSKKYKEEKSINQILPGHAPNSNSDLLFYKREKDLVDKLTEMESAKEKSEETGKIMNDFIFELQKLIGIKNPLNLIENLNSVDNDELIRRLQRIYRIVHKKTNNGPR